MSKDFKVEDLVWAKMKGYPPWPGKITLPCKGVKAMDKKHYVFFFGSENYAWIADGNISPHSDKLLEQNKSSKKNQPAAFKAAILQIEDLASNSKTPQKQNNVEVKPSPPEEKSPKLPLKKLAMPPPEKAIKLSPLSSSAEESSSTNLKEKVDTTPKKKSIKKRSLPDDEGKGDECPQPKVIKADTSFLPDESPNIAVVPPLDRVASGITATTKKIGFIGLGMMGQLLVKWLLNSGHDVTIYNRTSEKCQSFVLAGAFEANTASDVVFTCDIIFCCVSGPAAVKDLVFGNNGILNGLEKSDGSPKGIVELSSIDPNTVEEVAEAITSKGGRYLHAALSGSRQLAETASMVVLSSGNQELFGECESCFLSFSKKAYYLSQTIGTGSKINLICNMFTGTITAALAESVSLAETCKLPIRNFLDLVELSPISCPLVRDKVSAMYVKNFEPDNPLKHQQKDLQMAIQIGNTVSQPLTLTAVTHELYKRAKRDYSDMDISAIYNSFK